MTVFSNLASATIDIPRELLFCYWLLLLVVDYWLLTMLLLLTIEYALSFFKKDLIHGIILSNNNCFRSQLGEKIDQFYKN